MKFRGKVFHSVVREKNCFDMMLWDYIVKWVVGPGFSY